MKKSKVLICMVLCIVFAMTNTMVFADTATGNLLTLEDAKQIALDNDVQFKLQQSYIQQASEDYDDVYDKYSKTDNTNYNNIVDRASAEVSRKITIENSASKIRQEIFTRNNLKRTSDYEVTDAYYGVIEKKYALDDAKRAMDLKKQDLDTANIKFSLGLITKSALSQAQTTYKTSQTAYNKAFADVQDAMQTLSNKIGKNLDVFNVELDMNISMADISKIDLNKIKEDYMKNNGQFYSLKESYDIAEYKEQLTEDKYDYYSKRLVNNNSSIRKSLDDMMYKAQRDFDDVKYKYQEAEKDLDKTLATSLTGLNNLVESINDLNKSIEDTKVTVQESETKYQLGLISKMELDKTKSGLKDLENKLNTTVLTYNLSYLALTQYSDDTTASSK